MRALSERTVWVRKPPRHQLRPNSRARSPCRMLLRTERRRPSLAFPIQLRAPRQAMEISLKCHWPRCRWRWRKPTSNASSRTRPTRSVLSTRSCAFCASTRSSPASLALPRLRLPESDSTSSSCHRIAMRKPRGYPRASKPKVNFRSRLADSEKMAPWSKWWSQPRRLR